YDPATNASQVIVRAGAGWMLGRDPWVALSQIVWPSRGLSRSPTYPVTPLARSANGFLFAASPPAVRCSSRECASYEGAWGQPHAHRSPMLAGRAARPAHTCPDRGRGSPGFGDQ